MDTYLEIIDTRSGNACHTGIGSMFVSVDATRDAFESARQLHQDDGQFLLDLYIDGDLVDTINLDANGVELVSGVEPESVEHYIEFDQANWAAARKRLLE